LDVNPTEKRWSELLSDPTDHRNEIVFDKRQEN
jgi:hypothetical protein